MKKNIDHNDPAKDMNPERGNGAKLTNAQGMTIRYLRRSKVLRLATIRIL